jgi:hypothetical protein
MNVAQQTEGSSFVAPLSELARQIQREPSVERLGFGLQVAGRGGAGAIADKHFTPGREELAAGPMPWAPAVTGRACSAAYA